MKRLRTRDVLPTPDPHKLEANARRLASFIAKQPEVLERHIQKHAFSSRPCRCSVCWWRRAHVLKLVRTWDPE